MLLAELMRDCGALSRLQELQELLGFLVGPADSLNVSRLLALCQMEGISSARDLLNENTARQLENAITAEWQGQQLVRSQALDPGLGTQPTSIPASFQLLGQHFVIESFVLSKLVYDEIIYQENKVVRHRPGALDVMAAFGNREATLLQANELKTWHYSANLLACRQLVEQLDAEFWDESVHHAWLDCLRSLDADLTNEPHAPTAVQTQAWQRKQLQTQLASWAELRRDNVLYAKQSFGVPGCAFPCGYVEPYPEFYAKLKRIADRAGRRFGALSLSSKDDQRRASLEENRTRLVAFFSEMSGTLGMLEQIARNQLRGNVQTAAERDFLRQTYDHSGQLTFGSATRPDFSGWYCRLFYPRLQNPRDWRPLVSKPVVADVHTNLDGEETLEVGAGDAQLLIIVVDHAATPTVFVGPVSSYYEFWQPVTARLNDEEWNHRLASGSPPSRPDWVSPFQAQAVRREPERPLVTVTRRADQLSVTVDNYTANMKLTEFAVQRVSQHKNLHALDLSKSTIKDSTLRYLAKLDDLRSLDLSDTEVTDEGVAALAPHHHLQWLNLSGTTITDRVVPSLIQFGYLSHLDLRKTQISDKAVDELVQKLPYAEVLR